jgi:DNA-binding SARP family transcriptional activator/TolB-like protein
LSNVGFFGAGLQNGADLRQLSNVVADHTRESQAKRQLLLHILGDFAAEIDGHEIALATRKAKALTVYLALCDNAQDTRERLVGLLWSESNEERARASLRQVVHGIKFALDGAGFRGFRADKQTLSWVRGSIVSDLDEVLASAAHGKVHPRLLDTQRIDETLLSGLDNVDPAFHVWALAKRQLLRDRLTLALERLLPPDNDPATANSAALALLNLDPTHEVACRHLIRARAANGDIGGAMKAYKALWDLLDAEYDIEPSQETQDLIVGIKQLPSPGEAPVTVPLVPPSLPGVPRGAAASKRLFISVCAFDAGGVSEDKRHVVNGFRHEFVACLARFREWSVRTLPPLWESEPRTWSSPPEYVVEGSAYESSGTIRLVITFRDAITSVCIWSERYTITLSGWFETQQHIVRQIATALNVHVSAERLRRAAADVDLDLEVHDRWLRGQALLHRVNTADLKSAADLFEGLVRDAPDFSPALSGLVQINNTKHIVFPGRFRDPVQHMEDLRIAQRAVHLDPLDSRAQLGLAWSYQLVGRVNESTLHASLAAELNESDAWTLMSSGHIFAYCGNYERARMQGSASLELTPAPSRSQMTYFSAIKFLCGQYEESIEAGRHGLEYSPGFSVWLCAALGQLGRIEEAKAELDKSFAQIASHWQGTGKPTARDMARWMLHMFPVAIEADWERLRAGLAAAGAPVEGVRFGAW